MVKRNFKNGVKKVVKCNKKDFKSVQLDLKETENLFLNNTQKLIYNFK